MEDSERRGRGGIGLASLLVVALSAIGQSGLAQTVPLPAPSVGLAPIHQPGQNNPQPAVDYQAWLTSPTSNPVVRKPTGGSSCSAITPTDTRALFGDSGFAWLLVAGDWRFAGYSAPGVTQISVKPQTDDEWKMANPYIVVCGGKPTGFGWYIPRPAAPAPPPAVPAVQHVAGQIPLPGVSIGVSPGIKGLTGLNGWYWVIGMPASGAFTMSTSALGSTIDVEARPTSFIWDFGDGTAPLTTSSPGTPFPGPDGPGAIHHVYEAVNHDPGYVLTLTFVLQVRYRTNAGPWIDLGPVQRPISRTYPVIEIRSVVVARG